MTPRVLEIRGSARDSDSLEGMNVQFHLSAEHAIHAACQQSKGPYAKEKLWVLATTGQNPGYWVAAWLPKDKKLKQLGTAIGGIYYPA